MELLNGLDRICVRLTSKEFMKLGVYEFAGSLFTRDHNDFSFEITKTGLIEVCSLHTIS